MIRNYKDFEACFLIYCSLGDNLIGVEKKKVLISYIGEENFEKWINQLENINDLECRKKLKNYLEDKTLSDKEEERLMLMLVNVIKKSAVATSKEKKILDKVRNTYFKK